MSTALTFLGVCACAGFVKVYVPNDGDWTVLLANVALGVLTLMALLGAFRE